MQAMGFVADESAIDRVLAEHDGNIGQVVTALLGATKSPSK